MPNANTWGLLPKSLSDSETILTYVAAQLATHNADISAHGQSNEAVYNHRISSILDHLDDSIITAKILEANVTLDKTSLNKALIQPALEDIGAWTTDKTVTSNITFMCGAVRLQMTNVGAQHLYMWIVNSSNFLGFSFRNPLFEFIYREDAGYDTRTYIGMGLFTSDFAGFYFENENIYACIYVGGTEYLTLIPDLISEYDTHYVTKVNSTHNVEFYINDVLVHTETAHVPNTTYITTTINIKKNNGIADNHDSNISNLRLYQDLPIL